MKSKGSGGKSAGKPAGAQPSGGEQAKANDFLVVGIGASAGGLKALTQFFGHIPDNPPVAFVVVVHLSPEHESHLDLLLQRHTSMPVSQVRETLPIEPGHVYLIPPGKDLALSDGHLRPSDQPRQRVARAPIDFFFRALAETHGDRAVAIVLSGSGSDGALGIKTVKELGGVTLAQQLEQAEYDGMPRSAIATGFVDAVLPAEQLAEKVLDLQSRREQPVAPGTDVSPEENGEALTKTLTLLRSITGHDFSNYKRSTIERRLNRRLHLHGIDNYAAYLRFLRENHQDAQALLRDLLITVTGFFRDPEAFGKLESKVIPKLFDSKKPANDIRVWVPGCATGEEAYSIATLLLEHAERHHAAANLQVFASDVSEEALAQARDGLYFSTIEADVSEERLRRFFARETEGYRVRQEVRDVVLFAHHNLLRDAPFSKVHLISCRNLLIYLRRNVHERLYELFHYALVPDGYLFLGTSESADGSELFEHVDKEARIFQRRAVPHRIPTLPQIPIAVAEPSITTGPKHDGRGSIFERLYPRLMASHAPPSLVVNTQHEIVHLFEGSQRYLRLAAGRPSQNLLKLVPPELRLELRSALSKALTQSNTVTVPALPVKVEGQTRLVELIVQPIREEGLSNYAHVVFREIERRGPESSDATTDGHSLDQGMTKPSSRAGRPAENAERIIHQLEAENDRLKEELRTSIEEHESSVEELKSSNEEMQSTNEELKSTAEELETSREELQSINEELVTVNEEHKNKIDELIRANNDLQNLMAATDMGTLFLDRDLRIKLFTPRVVDLLNLIASDIGRPLAHFTNILSYGDLLSDARQVLRNLTPVEQETRAENGKWYSVRLRPYRTLDDRIDGLVITFVDLTAMKQAEDEIRRSEENYRLLIDSLPEYAIFTMDREGRIVSWNKSAERMLGYDEADILGRSFDILFTEEDAEKGIPAQAMEAAGGAGYSSIERWHVRKDGTRFWSTGTIAALYGDDGQLRGFAEIMRDNTERRAAEQALLSSQAELEQAKVMLEQRVELRTKQVRSLATALALAEQQERSRISRVLHDDLQQVLYGLEVKTQMMERQLADKSQNDLRVPIEQIDQLVHKAIDITRNLTVEINPPVLKHEGLAEALRWLKSHMKQSFNLDVEIKGECAIRDEDTRALLFQLLRELLFNIVKHAGVSNARVEIGEQNGECVVRVTDDGKGFDPQPLTSKNQAYRRLGLTSANERVKLFGGRLEIDSAPGRGTSVTILVPV